jgi:hypothetical protein
MHRMIQYWNWRNRIAYAPPGEGEGGGEGGEGGEGNETQEGGEGSQTQSGGNSEDEIIKLDGHKLITELFGKQKGEEYDPEKDTPPEGIFTAEEITTHLTDGLKSIAIPDELIPADFNPSDRTQMKAVLRGAMELGVRHALNLSFKPVENAMRMHAHQVDKNIRTQMRDMGSMNTTEKLLAREIPASANPEYEGLIQATYDTALKRTKDPKKAIEVTKKSLAAMSININDSGDRTNRGGSTEGSQGVKTGKSALDAFMPLPAKAGPSSTASRMK